MADKITVSQRSLNMSKIKGKDTSIEIKFRKGLYRNGIRYSLRKQIFGKPDLIIPSKRIAIFVNGCFWHQHENCKLANMPKSNIEFWKKKLDGNKVRDNTVDEELTVAGWKVIRVWECEIEDHYVETVNRISDEIKFYKKPIRD